MSKVEQMDDIDKLYIAEQIVLDIDDERIFTAFIATLIDDWFDVHGRTFEEAMEFMYYVAEMKEKVRNKLKEVDSWYR